MAKYVSGLVSVIMPTYRRSEKLVRAIKSVLNQSYSNLELLLVNDNDPEDDYTKELIGKIEPFIKDIRFRLIMQETHINGAAARNRGIKAAKGEFIAFLDDDDWWNLEKLKIQLKVLSGLSDDWGGVSCRYAFVDQSRKVIEKSPSYQDGNIYKDILNLMTDVTTCSLLIKHTALDETGGFDESLLRHQDFQLLINFSYRFKLKLVNECLLNIDVSDAQNRPNGKELLEYKKKFFESISSVLSTLSNRDRKCIQCMHRFELGYVFFKSKDFKSGMKYFLSGFVSLQAVGLCCKKIFRKVKGKLFR